MPHEIYLVESHWFFFFAVLIFEFLEEYNRELKYNPHLKKDSKNHWCSPKQWGDKHSKRVSDIDCSPRPGQRKCVTVLAQPLAEVEIS